MTTGWIAGVVLWREAWWSPFATIAISVVLHLFATVLLLFPSTPAYIVRRIVIPFAMLYLWFDLLLNARYTFGSKQRDIWLGSLCWFVFHQMLTVAFTFNGQDGGECVPRWCVPDWEWEERERGLHAKGDKDMSTPNRPSWWRRAYIPARPEWARQQRIIPRQWRLLPYPTTLPDRLLWALDVMFFLRHGTASLFAEEMRGLEWSKDKLEVAGQAQFKARQAGLSRPSHAPHILPFGYVDAEWPFPILSAILFLLATTYMGQSDIRSSSAADFYRLPLAQQLMLTMSVGTSFVTSTSLPEFVLLPLFQRWPLRIPPTALKPAFRTVVQSKSLTELWQYRWHTFAKRGFVRLANMLPPYGKQWRGNRAVQTLKVFFCSGVVHSVIFVRAYPTPTWRDPITIVHIFLRPFAMLFFLSQAALVLVEHAWPRVFLPQQSEQDGKTARKWTAYARNAWVWTMMLLTGHLLVLELVAAGMLTREELASSSPIGQAVDVYAFLRRKLRRGGDLLA